MSKKNETKKELKVKFGENAFYEKSLKLDEMKHLFISGQPQSGKTKIVKNIIRAAMAGSPEENIFLIVNTTGLDYFGYEKSEFLPLGTVDLEDAYAVTHLAKEIMDERYKTFAQKTVSNIGEYREVAKEGETLPNVFLVLDNYSDMVQYSFALEKDLMKLLTRGSKVGVNVILVSDLIWGSNLTREMMGLFNARITTKHNAPLEIARALGIYKEGMFSFRYGDGSIDERALFLEENEGFVILNDGHLEKLKLTEIDELESRKNASEISQKHQLPDNPEIDEINLNDYKYYFVDRGDSEWVGELGGYIRPRKRKKGIF